MNNTDKKLQTVYLPLDGFSKSQFQRVGILDMAKEVQNVYIFTEEELKAERAKWMSSKWISVKDQLPPITIDESKDLNESKPVIGLLANGEVYKMALNHWYESEPDEFGWHYHDCGEHCDSVTHWMPLPPKQ